MKEKVKTFFCVLFLLCTLPYIITMCFRQSASPKEAGSGAKTEPEVLSADSQKAGEELDIEEYLTGVVAQEISMNYEPEVLKAQAVLARTNLKNAMEKGEALPESLNQEALLKLWGEEGFGANYRKLQEAVRDTRGVVLTSQGSYIYAAFHAVSAGKTRAAAEALETENMPYLTAADSSADISSGDFLKVIFLEKEKFAQKLTENFPSLNLDGGNPLLSLTISARDSSDYVLKIQNGEVTISGEEFRNALELNSACFYLKEVEGKIRIVTKGLGHGLGMSQYGANELARQGMAYPEILSYYFKNVEISD